MGKAAQNSAKYVIKAKLKSSGIVEKPDIVGAIFGQTEGLLGDDLDLRELQQRGRIGRIHVETREEDGSSTAEIRIPSSLDATNTSILAASLETIERVGPTNAEIKVEKIKDERVSKRDYIVKRAKQLLSDMQSDQPDTNEVTEEVKQEVREREISEHKGFEAGPSVEAKDEIILVEGRADLLNLLRHGVKNVVALGGTSVPDELCGVTKGKKVTAFLDGDRGGDLILRELEEKIETDYVARAPDSREVEELEEKTVHESIRDKEPLKYTGVEEVEEEETPGELEDILEQLVGTRAAHLVNEEYEVETKLPISNLHEKLRELDECHAIALDGEVDNELVEKAEQAGVKYLLGMEKTGYANSSDLKIVTRKEKPHP